MQKRVRKGLVFGISMSQIFLLVSFTFAVAFIINQEAGLAGADTTDEVAQSNAYADSSAVAGKSAPPVTTGIGQVFKDITTAKLIKPAPGSGLGTTTTGLGGVGNALVTGLFWGVLIGGVAYMIGGMLGLSKYNQGVLFKAGLFAGIGGGLARLAVNSFGKGAVGSKTFLGMSGGTTGLLAGGAIFIAIFIFMYQTKKTQVVTFNCQPWEAPLGGKDCDKCNGNPLVPCSEYRCKSLGQACEIVNKGTEKEQCVWVSKFDVNSPTITPWNTPLTSGLKYVPLETRPSSKGTKIINPENENGCLAPFTPLKFGIVTDKPAQCKLDYTATNYSDKQFYFGGSNYYEKNHTQEMRLPSPNDDDANSPAFGNGGTFQLWVQCQDANGNKNDDQYLVQFCVDKSPDTTAPTIEGSSIISGSPVQFKVDTLSLDVYTNEPAQCKWSRQDKSYDSMENLMVCASGGEEVNGNLQYTCTGNMTGIKDREANDFYFRCRDSAGNTNVQSNKITLLGSQPLNILSILPNETVFGSTTTIPLDIEIVTDAGADEGKAVCYYSGALTSEFNEMFETNSYMHKQTFYLESGNYTYSFKCVDAGGNIAERNTTFNVFVDNNAPKVTRAYRDQAMKIVTDEDAECSYSIQNCNFEIGKGIKLDYANINIKTQLFAPWTAGVTYYMKCVDKYGNQPNPGECSVIVSPRPLSFASLTSSFGTIGTITSGSSGSGTGSTGTIGTVV